MPLNIVTPVKSLKRAFDDWNVASQEENTGTPDPYFWLRPTNFQNMPVRKKRRLNRTVTRGRSRRRRRVFRKRLRRMPARRKNLKFVGDRPSRGPFVKTVVNRTATLTMNTLEHGDPDWWSINYVKRGTAKNERDSSKIVCRGIRTEIFLYTNPKEPVFLNMAWICNKSERALTDEFVPTQEDFFRSYDQFRSRSIGAPNPAYNGMEIHMNAINTDVWAVLKHKRMVFWGRESNTYWDRGSFKIKRFWMPIKKEFRFNDDSSIPENETQIPNNGSIFLVIWASQADLPAGSTKANIVQYWCRNIMYFTDDD